MMDAFEVMQKVIEYKLALPNAEVVFWVDGEEICDPMDHRYTAQAPRKVEVCDMVLFDELYLADDEALERIEEEMGETWTGDDASLAIAAKARFDEISKPMIVVYMGAK
jgi:hypothetical protein